MTTTTRWLTAFIDERYDIDYDNNELHCKRCGELVDWVTRHAAEKHGDDVEVMPAVNENSLHRF